MAGDSTLTVNPCPLDYNLVKVCNAIEPDQVQWQRRSNAFNLFNRSGD